MASKTRSSFAKRQKEVARHARLKEKQARRLDAKQKSAESEPDSAAPDSNEDPDLAGIVLGPQAPVEELEADEDEER